MFSKHGVALANVWAKPWTANIWPIDRLHFLMLIISLLLIVDPDSLFRIKRINRIVCDRKVEDLILKNWKS